MKLAACILQWIIILAILPGIKLMIDNGIPVLQAQGVDAQTIAWIGILPWLIPLCWFAGTIMWLIQPPKPKNPYAEAPKNPPKIVRF